MKNPLLIWFALLVLSFSASGTEPFFRPDDVVALVGGEDVAVMRDEPVLELAVLAQPGLQGVRFRNLAFEGDTVFEQPRELNFPSWEEQLTRTGASMVVAQFGKMESFAGAEGLPAFVHAYEQLAARFQKGGCRVALLSPLLFVTSPFLPEEAAAREQRLAQLRIYEDAIREMAARLQIVFVEDAAGEMDLGAAALPNNPAALFASLAPAYARGLSLAREPAFNSTSSPVWRLLREKNQLWFHYWRPQNWAFLHGDRTEQPSSRDHLDPSKRWFPAEMEKWLPLIAAKETAIRAALSPTPAP